MKELENILSENLNIIEEKNNEYINPDQKELENNTLENTENEEINIEELVKQLPVVGVGDSVLLGAINELYNVFPNGYFDGKVSRSIRDGEKVLSDLKDNEKLGDILILALANNSDYFEWRINELMDIIGDRQVYWVDAVLADDPQFNEKFKIYASNHSNIHIVEWEEKSKNHPEYFYADGIHVKGDGIAAYANTIYEAIYNDYVEKYEGGLKYE